MPRFDKTGPLGFGPRTGRGLGPCGQGRGFGKLWRFGSEVSKREEIEILNEEEEILEEELKAIRKRLAEIRSQK